MSATILEITESESTRMFVELKKIAFLLAHDRFKTHNKDFGPTTYREIFGNDVAAGKVCRAHDVCVMGQCDTATVHPPGLQQHGG